MKILFPLEYYYPSDIGGPANALYWHTQMLKKNGIDSVVVTSDVGTETKGIKSDEWIIDGNSKLIYCSGGRLSFKIFRNTLKEIGKCDAVHLSSVCYPYNVFITVYAIFKGKRVIISPRGELFPQAYKTKKYFLKTVLFSVYRLFQKQILFHATSTEEKECISKIFQKSKIVVQPNLIETTYNDVPQNRSDDIVFLGRINPIKSIDKLIKALPLSDLFMKREGKLIIIGAARLPEEIKYKQKIEKMIDAFGLSERVVFLGVKEGNEKIKVLNTSKALILPSESENFGNVIIEALSQSIPVIASKGTPWQVLEEKKIGWWRSNEPQRLSIAIDELYSLSDSEYAKYCEEAKKYVEDYFDIIKSKHNIWPNMYSSIVENRD